MIKKCGEFWLRIRRLKVRYEDMYQAVLIKCAKSALLAENAVVRSNKRELDLVQKKFDKSAEERDYTRKYIKLNQ